MEGENVTSPGFLEFLEAKNTVAYNPHISLETMTDMINSFWYGKHYTTADCTKALEELKQEAKDLKMYNKNK